MKAAISGVSAAGEGGGAVRRPPAAASHTLVRWFARLPQASFIELGACFGRLISDQLSMHKLSTCRLCSQNAPVGPAALQDLPAALLRHLHTPPAALQPRTDVAREPAADMQCNGMRCACARDPEAGWHRAVTAQHDTHAAP